MPSTILKNDKNNPLRTISSDTYESLNLKGQKSSESKEVTFKDVVVGPRVEL